MGRGGSAGVSAYLAEIAPQNRKGLFVSWQSASTQVAVVASALAGAATNRLLSPKAVDAWGWRLPFWLGCAIIPLLFRLRHSLLESDEFAARSQHPGVAEILRSLLRNRALVFSSLLVISQIIFAGGTQVRLERWEDRGFRRRSGSGFQTGFCSGGLAKTVCSDARGVAICECGHEAASATAT